MDLTSPHGLVARPLCILFDDILRQRGSFQQLARFSSEPSALTFRIQSNATQLSAELFRLFVTEAVTRASTEATFHEDSKVHPHHLEAIMVQLLLDF